MEREKGAAHTWIVVLITGDRDFGAEVRSLVSKGFKVLVLHDGNANTSFTTQASASSKDWFKLTSMACQDLVKDGGVELFFTLKSPDDERCYSRIKTACKLQNWDVKKVFLRAEEKKLGVARVVFENDEHAQEAMRQRLLTDAGGAFVNGIRTHFISQLIFCFEVDGKKLYWTDEEVEKLLDTFRTAWGATLSEPSIEHRLFVRVTSTDRRATIKSLTTNDGTKLEGRF